MTTIVHSDRTVTADDLSLLRVFVCLSFLRHSVYVGMAVIKQHTTIYK